MKKKLTIAAVLAAPLALAVWWWVRSRPIEEVTDGLVR